MNSLPINPGMITILSIGVPQLTRTLPSLKAATLLVKEIEAVPDLGVTIDSCLSYNEHITKAISNYFFKSTSNRVRNLTNANLKE